jgi:cytochrome P450
MAYDTQAAGAGPEPVTDWANDWDWLDDQWGERAPEIWAELRAQGCTMAFTERYGRAFMPLTHEAVNAIAHDPEHFSSFRVSVSLPDSPVRKAPPITTDPPDHADQRRLLLPPFSPRQIADKERPTRNYCRSLIAALDGSDIADAAVDYSQHIPVHVIAEMIGVPESDADVFRDWVFRNFQLAPRDNDVKRVLQIEMNDYFGALLDERAVDPRDDLATLIGRAEIEGEPVSRELQCGYLMLLILAGVDTTWSSIGSGLWHFATHPADRDRLAGLPHDDPRWVMAMEEVLRFYSPVTMARQVVADTEVSGCPVRHGEQVLLTFPAANRDPAVFDRADEFVIDRAVNRHAAFGLGVHRCLGSNLARMEVLVAIQEWLTAFPHYALDDRSPVTWANGQVRGPRSVPVKLNR